jgi:ABC-type multidrug transport system ATPase subunit/pSer/pThr/pTyr-binding forkhead associated (FHA) protein
MEEALLCLRITAGNESLVVSGKTPVTIGRESHCDVVIDDPMVSRAHLKVSPSAGGWLIEDLGSRNGTFANGKRIAVLEFGDDGASVQLGDPDGVVVRLLPVAEEAPLGDGLAAAEVPQGTVLAGTEAGAVAIVGDAGVGPRAGTVISIGRASDNTVVLADDLLVSRHHAQVRAQGHKGELTDLGSSNGTFVNGQRVTTAVIGSDDVITIGQHDLHLTSTGIEPWVGGGIRFAASGLMVRAPHGAVLLDGVDLAIAKSGFLAILGPSGAGKSTLLNALTGVRPADAGTISYEGRNFYQEYESLRRKLGIVPQDDVLYVQLKVRQALMYAAELRFPPEVSKAEKQQRVTQVMAELGLAERAELPIKDLSGGQRKRVSIALELLTRPSLLFLDEPTSGLDPGFERNVMQLLRSLADGGRTVVVVTHSVASLDMCDSVLVMAPGGRPAFFGPPRAALAFFGQDDYQGIFQVLSDSAGIDWPAKFATSDERRRFLPLVPGTATADVPLTPPTPKRSQSFFRQFATLTSRHLSVLRSDRATLLLLAAQAVFLGLLQLVVLPRGQLAPPTSGSLRIFSEAPEILLNPVEIATALGLANAATVLVKERAIFRRERTVGLSIPAYLASKVVILSTVAILQAAILVAFATFDEGGPTSALALGRPFIELTAVLSLTGMAAMALGLLISAFASTEIMAMTILPVVLVVENVFAMGGLGPNSLAKPVLNQAQYVSSAQWGFAAAAATSDLNHLEGLSTVVEQIPTVNSAALDRFFSKPVETHGERRYQHVRVVWLEDMGALLALFILALIATGLALSRLDPALIR